MTIVLSITATFLGTIFYIPFSIIALMFTCESHIKKLIRLKFDGKFLCCCSQNIFWVSLYIGLALSFLVEITNFAYGLKREDALYVISEPVGLLIQLLHAIYFKHFVSGYKAYFIDNQLPVYAA